MTTRAATSVVPIRYASIESRFGWTDATWQALVAAAPRSWMLHREHLASESHESMGMLAAYLGLRAVFADYSMLAAPVTPTTSILPYYSRIDSTLGAPVAPPRKLLRNVVEDLLAEGRGALGRAAFARLVAGYGAPSDSLALVTRIAEVERRPPPRETVEGLLATPFSTADEARPYVGEWVGDVWMNEDEPRTGRMTLRVRVVDGRVVGETVHHMAPGEEMLQPWTYLRVTPKGLTFGFMNGMRPRGMLLYEGTLRGDSLSGIMRFGGVEFRLPDGTLPPDLHFAFSRVGSR
jgi:hypothetical protein